MSFDRYFIPDKFVVGDTVYLRDNQAKHCIAVMRHKKGDEIVLFNGTGGEYCAEIVGLAKREVMLTIKKFAPIERELSVNIILLVAPPKQKRFEFLIEKATELGVNKITPLVSKRSVRVKNELSETQRKRYIAKIIEACKQCGRNRLPALTAPVKLQDALATQADMRLLLSLEGSPDAVEILQKSPAPSTIALAVGPEGGFTKEELADFRNNGWLEWRLANTTLRVETAALAALAYLNCVFV